MRASRVFMAPTVRRGGWRHCGWLVPPKVDSEILWRAYSSADSNIKRMAAWAMAQAQMKKYYKTIRDMLRDEERSNRILAIGLQRKAVG